MLEPLARELLPHQAARALKQFILNKQLHTGDQLPSERYLTELLGVSRTVVREALQQLVADGLLVKEPGRGVFVREFDSRRLHEQAGKSDSGNSQTRSLLEVRAALEIGALTFVAQRISADELEQLTSLVREMRARLDAGQPIGTQDHAFHDLLTQATHNPSFAYFKGLVQDAIQSAVQGQMLGYARPADYNSVETAEQLLAALRRRDIVDAQRAMHNHLLMDRPPEQARVFLFVDDAEVAVQQKLTRRIHPAHKYPHNPVLCPEQPWEGDSVLPSATVIYDHERLLYHMWYHGHQRLSPREEIYSLCYASSIDGVHWHKPQLGNIDFRGTTANNLVMPWADPHQGDVISATILPTVNGEQSPRYTMVYFGAGIHSMGVRLASSADGLQWQPSPEQQLYNENNEPVGELLYCLPEPAADRVAAYYRIPLRAQPRAALGRMESHDLHHWHAHREILSADKDDPPDSELAGITPFRYGDLTLGFLWLYRREQGTTELQIVSSRDGINWQRVGDRLPFLSIGEANAFDAQSIIRPTVPVVVGNELWFYYAGSAQSAHSWQPPTYRIGLATLTLDRFAALEADEEEGMLTTTAIPCPDRLQLLVNAVIKPGGALTVEVLDSDGNLIEGYSRNEMLSIEGSAVYHSIGWSRHRDLSALAGQSLHFRFHLRRAALYAFRLAHPEARASDLVAGIC